MTYDNRPYRGPREDRAPQPVSVPDPRLRELLTFLRDSCREIAVQIDRYLGDERAPRGFETAPRERSAAFSGQQPAYNPRGFEQAPPARSVARARAEEPEDIRTSLERLRDEARSVSDDALQMEPARLRLLIEAITAETRSFQLLAEDPEDQDLAAKILRTLTAVVSEHRPGHVYGLARHHNADWNDLAMRAREDLASGNLHRARHDEGNARGGRDDDHGGTF
ncbi:MAG: hypothetical protein Q8Q09_07715 [Deltaproteobacteria bacterium]|nr:hypothetical protein [Deltaproteobacteria bacterium]